MAEEAGSALSSPKLGSKVKPAKQRVKHRKVRAGVTIFKGHPSYQIMMNLKLGIAYSSGRSAARRTGPLEPNDFHTVFTQTFPPEGCSTTPAHSTRIFQFKDHAPLAFRHLREHFGVSEQDYVVSICGENSLRELGTPGKSGAVFYLTEDYKYLIKTVSKKESKFLRRMLPNYYAHVMSCDSTLLPRFYGLIRITTQLGRNIRMVVMNNLMPEEATIHEKYDLKGSTLGRYATDAERADPNCTLKDLDWRHSLAMPQPTLQLLSKQVEADAAFLRELKIMDYSMLAMLHYPGREDCEWVPSPDLGAATPPEEAPPERLVLPHSVGHELARAPTGLGLVVPPYDEASPLNDSPRSPISAPPPLPEAMSYESEVKAAMDADGDGIITLEEEVAYAKRLGGIGLSAPALAGGVQPYRRPSGLSRSASVSRSGSIGSTPRLLMGDSFKGTRTASVAADPAAEPQGSDESEDESEIAAEMRLPNVSPTELSVAYERSQARARDGRREPVAPVRIDDGLPCRLETGEEVVFFCGVIDILQQYGLRKRLEHRYKAIRYVRDRSGISVTDPKTYASRFLSFVLNLFEEQGAASARAAAPPGLLHEGAGVGAPAGAALRTLVGLGGTPIVSPAEPPGD
jgi:1-phosphatidylinositol-4-phosphate 5-kinase